LPLNGKRGCSTVGGTAPPPHAAVAGQDVGAPNSVWMVCDAVTSTQYVSSRSTEPHGAGRVKPE
jgi:hypothetical protein